MIGVKGLARQGIGTKTLVLIYDGCWTTDIKRAIIVGDKVDMNERSSLLYCAPNLLKSVKDLKHLKIEIQTKGYENYVGDNLNLSITILGKLTKTTSTNYKLKIKGIIQSLASKGVKMINPIQIHGSELGGLEWDLSKHAQAEDK